MAGLTEHETQELERKLKCGRYEETFPRVMYSVLEDVFYLVQTANWHLKRDGHTQEWRENIACHMYQLRSALEKALDWAQEVEKKTGLSGKALADDWA